MNKGLQSFINDMSALMRRKKDDMGKRQSLFEALSPGNVGNVFEIPPSQAQFANTYSPNAYGVPVRVLDIAGDDALGEMICVSIQQERIVDDAESAAIASDNDRVEGPLVGVVEFGAGAGLATLEFDIPAPGFTPGFVTQVNPGQGLIGPLNPGSTPQTDSLLVARRTNGVLLTLPASSLRVLVRNDANAPYLIKGTMFPFAPNAARSLNDFKNPGKIRVHATYGRRPFQSVLTRTIPICFAMGNAGSPPSGTTSFLADFTNSIGAYIRFNIPAYAKTVYFPRLPLASTSLVVNTYQTQLKVPPQAGTGTAISLTGSYIVPNGSIGPIQIGPLDTIIELNNIEPFAIENMSAVFVLGI